MNDRMHTGAGARDVRESSGTKSETSKQEQFEALVEWIRHGHVHYESPAPQNVRGDPTEGFWNWNTGIPVVDGNLCYHVFVVQDQCLSRKGFIAGKTPFGKAAVMEAARREYVGKGIPERLVQRGLRTRFGRELLGGIDASVWKRFESVVLRPRLTRHGNLSRAYFEEWFGSVSGKASGMSGPRAEAFVQIVLGEDWKKAVPYEPSIFRRYGFREKTAGETGRRNQVSRRDDGGWGY